MRGKLVCVVNAGLVGTGSLAGLPTPTVGRQEPLPEKHSLLVTQ